MSSSGDAVASPLARKFLRLHLADWVGPIRLARLLEYFGTIDDVLSASLAALQRVSGIGPATAQAIFASRSDESAEREVESAGKLGLRILCLHDSEYPDVLRRINDPPICLYMRGTFRIEDKAALAIVGTRRCSRYGSEQGRRFGALLAGAGFTVVSGLARGIDAAAHEGALEARGRTIAVLGNGLSSIYPPENTELAGRIAESGAVITEVPLDAAPDRQNFPRRNRIVIGLSTGVLVVEAGRTSGALITARLATEYNREVFVLPGRVDVPSAAGSNGLLRDGAKLVTCLEDILDELQAVERKELSPADRSNEAEQRPQPTLFDPSPDERAVLDALGPDEVSLHAIHEACALPVHRIATVLMNLQLKGVVRQLPGDRYLRGKRSADARRTG